MNAAIPAPAAVPVPRFKLMDVAFGDTRLRPRRLVLEARIRPDGRESYTTSGETGGVGGFTEQLRTKEEWLIWIDRFSDDLTGRELREAKEAARAEFAEPKCWTEFRERFAATGDPYLK